MSEKSGPAVTGTQPSIPEHGTDSVAEKIADQARGVGAQAASVATDLAAEVRERGSSIAEDVKSRVLSTAEGQREGIADQIGGVAEALHRSGEQFKGNQEWVAHLVERGAGELGTLAETLRTNDLQGLMEKLQDLAKRQPAVFVGAAMAAGFATVRLGKIAVAGATKADLPTLPEMSREPE
jgi:hypothetical protein